MNKNFVLLPLLLLFQLVSAQEMKFKDAQFDNGLVYPIADFSVNLETESKLNENIQAIFAKYAEQDYCVGQYGYVQQTSFIQLHFYFNCIDMDESKNEYHLFDLGNGEPCALSSMFLDKQKKRYREYFRKKVAEHYTNNDKVAPSEEILETLNIDDLTVKLLESGLEISSTSLDGWPEKNMIVYWSEIRTYLKTTFL